MPTPSEQKALTFVAIVILLGGAVRVLKASASAPVPTLIEQQALARQATAAESAAAKAHVSKAAKHGKSTRSDTLPRVTAVNASGAGAGSLAVAASPPPVSRLGFPPPGARIDINPGIQQPATPTAQPAKPGRKTTGKPVIAGPIDVNAATIDEIEALPHVGPVLARKIVANRDSLGPFGSLDALRRVKGVGAATTRDLAPYVTFGRAGGAGVVHP